jgi:5-methylcytosine-specific restriction endonuclease McrA
MPKSKSKKKGRQSKQTYKKKTIPKALREQVWIKNIGASFESECTVSWCKNIINVFDFHVGHDVPESKGGETSIDNLKPICARCNLSMGSNYSIKEWEKQFAAEKKCCVACVIM